MDARQIKKKADAYDYFFCSPRNNHLAIHEMLHAETPPDILRPLIIRQSGRTPPC